MINVVKTNKMEVDGTIPLKGLNHKSDACIFLKALPEIFTYSHRLLFYVDEDLVNHQWRV